MAKYAYTPLRYDTRARLDAAKIPAYRTYDELINYLLDIYEAHQQLPVPQDPLQQLYDERFKMPKTVQKRSRR